MRYSRIAGLASGAIRYVNSGTRLAALGWATRSWREGRPTTDVAREISLGLQSFPSASSNTLATASEMMGPASIRNPAR